MTVSTQLPHNGTPLFPDRLDNPDWDNQGDASSAKLAHVLARRARELAQEPPAPATGKTVDVLVFVMGGERYAIAVSHVQEIHPLTQLTTVPRTPDFVAGVFSARGRILSVLDLRPFFGLAVDEISNQTKIIVVSNTDDTQPMTLGLLADNVINVITLFEDDIGLPLTTHTGVNGEYLQGITPDMVAILNLNILLSDERLIIHET